MKSLSEEANVGLNVGSNTINVSVLAEDNVTTKTYTTTVTRAAPSSSDSPGGGVVGGTAGGSNSGGTACSVIVNGSGDASFKTSTTSTNTAAATTGIFGRSSDWISWQDNPIATGNDYMAMGGEQVMNEKRLAYRAEQ